MCKKSALVTLAIGQRFEVMFDMIARKSFDKYCERHGYDLIVVKQPLDQSDRAMRRSPAWQKLLILSQNWSNKYEQIIWADTDIIINNDNAPSITADTPVDKVSGVEAYAGPTKRLCKISKDRYREYRLSTGAKPHDVPDGKSYYRALKVDNIADVDTVLQTGVFVCSPKHHREIFEHIYYKYEGIPGDGGKWHYEMPWMSYELVKNGFMHWIDPAFNNTAALDVSLFYPFLFFDGEPVNRSELNELQAKALLNIYDLGYFMHFAGNGKLMLPFSAYLKHRDKLVA